MNRHKELPINQHMNPWTLLYAIPGKTPTETIGLLRLCGIDVLINEIPPPSVPVCDPYREIAASILLQAIDDTLHGHGQTRGEARHWLLADQNGFPYWCSVLDLNYLEVRRLLREKLDGKWYRQVSMNRHKEIVYDGH